MKKILMLLAVKKLLVIFVIIFMLIHQHQAQSQALPVVAPAANFVVNRAVGGVLTRVAIARGFAANDPRIGATLAGVSSSLTAANVASTVAGVGLAIAGAPVWLTVAASLGVFAIGAAIVAGNATVSLSNGKLVVDAPGGVPAPAYTPVVTSNPDRYAALEDLGLKVYRDASCQPSQYCYAYPSLPSGALPYQYNPNLGDSTQGQAWVVFFSLQDLVANLPDGFRKSGTVYHQVLQDRAQDVKWDWVQPPHFEFSDNGTPRLVGIKQMTVTCVSGPCSSTSIQSNWDSTSGFVQVNIIEGARQYQNLAEAYPNLSSAVKSQQLSDSTIAQIADQAWLRAAAQPGYQGVPYSVTQPVTAADVAAWRAENPINAPTLNDLLAPANNPGIATVPVSPTVTASASDPTPNPGALTNVNVVNAPRIDLGADPNVVAPALEVTPTAWEILAPIMSLFPELKGYQAPNHASACPKPVFDIFGKSIVMDSHCTIAEQYRSTIGAVMVSVWVIVGLFILLSA
ncbi:hypothetical protein ACO0LF_29760 [Undibacterium sp. Di27W]|uniref:hypothetical protein n=1 Tax=Undibacterium sp. Di27W TaxID=3413036 RepID=UPI003BEFFC2D